MGEGEINLDTSIEDNNTCDDISTSAAEEWLFGEKVTRIQPDYSLFNLIYSRVWHVTYQCSTTVVCFVFISSLQ